MARQEVNIGVEGNDGTGDSIRESFKKVNENFVELYAVFGAGGQINFTTLSDTPDQLLPNTIPLINDAGTFINFVELASNSAANPNQQDTITFSYDVSGKLVISSAFKQISDDLSPTLGGPINAAGFGIAGVAISDEAALAVNLAHDGLSNITIDDLVITRGYADQRYITSGLPLRTDDEPAGQLHYTFEIFRYIDFSLEITSHYDEDQNLITGGHGLDSGANGSPFVFQAEDTDPNNLTSGTTYYIRVISPTRIYLYTFGNREYSTTSIASDAEQFKINVSGAIDPNDTHTIRDATFDPTLSGNFLSNITVPRSSVTLRSGDTMTGALYLHDHPGELAGQGTPNGPSDLQAATKFYVDNTSYSSPEVLFVSTTGDDTMQGVPPGKEGTSNTYAFASINAAAQRAEELIKSGPVKPGPYIQTLTFTEGAVQKESRVIRANVDSPVFSQARNLLTLNREFIQKEVIAYVNYTFPDFSYNQEICERDVGLLVDAISIDINRGLNTNYLTRQAAERYYSSVSGRIAISVQLSETVSAINIARDISEAVLQNKLFQEQQIDDITNASPALVSTTGQHGWSDKNIIKIQDPGGLAETFVNGLTAYIKVFNTTSFELYQDEDLTIPVDTSVLVAGFTSGGVVGLLYQTDAEQQFDDGVVAISNITNTNPARVSTTDFHFLSDNDQITIQGISSGLSTLNGNSYYVKKIDDTTIDLYTSATAIGVNISSVTLNAGDINTPVRIVTESAHGLSSSTEITITQVSGTTQLNQSQFFVNVIDTVTIDLYTDSGLTLPLNATGYDSYVGGGVITTNSFDATGLASYSSGGGTLVKESNADPLAVVAVRDKWDLITTIITNGLDAGANIVYGSTYKIVLTNGAQSFIDQTNPANTDALPGKVIRGKRSKAIGQIVNFTNDVGIEAGTDPVSGLLEPNPTVFQMHLLSAKDFERGEPLEFGNFIRDKEVVIRVEAGNYEEDFPIRLSNNVSLKGDEFRRVNISPKTETDSYSARVSQSKWANLYFYRDNVFDGLPVARAGKPFLNQEGISQGKFGYHYLYQPDKPLNVGLAINNPGNYKIASQIIKENKDYIVEETIKFISDKFPDLTYDVSKCRRDTRLIVDALSKDLINGGEEFSLEVQGSYHELGYTEFQTQLGDSTEEIATAAAIDNISSLCASLLNGIAPTYVDQISSFNVTAAAYTPTTGVLVLTIGTHNLVTGDYIEIAPGSLTFTCASDGNTVPYSYPRSTDPAYQEKLEITAYSSTTITVNVGISPETSTHTFVSALSNAVTYQEYTAGSAEVLAIETPDISLGPGESGTVTIVGNLIDKINFVFNTEYNPPLRNDEVDMFLMADTTIIRNVSCRGHGGFMCVLDPVGQVLTKSPYIQTASSFSRSRGRQVFSGGMFVDAYVGNLPTRIISKASPFKIQVQSTPGEGLRLRPPQLPCPFYVEGRRYQVNAISDYDGDQGIAFLYLDANSNEGDGYLESQFTDPVVERDIFLQTAGNRSMLANDFTQINDLGYGLVCVNAAFSEQVSTFTYYCHTAMYAANGSEIRALNCSNGYGNFGLVAEGADPNEVPDQVILTYDSVQSAKAYSDGTTNSFDDSAIVVYDMERPPNPNSIITLTHATPAIGTLNYRISAVLCLSDRDNNGVYGEISAEEFLNTGVKTLDAGTLAGTTTATGIYSNIETTSSGSGVGCLVNVNVSVTGSPGTVTVTIANTGENYTVGETLTISGDDLGGTSPANDLTIDVDTIYGSTPGVLNNVVYRLDLIADDVAADDYFGTIQETIANNTYINYRDSFQFIVSRVINPLRLVTRPSTAINFDESDNVTYRSISFQSTDSASRPLPTLFTLTGNVSVTLGETLTQSVAVNTITTTGNISVTAGETLTQTSSNATAEVLNTVVNGSAIEVINTTGTFNLVNELTGSVSGALGANSVPLSTAATGTLTFATAKVFNILSSNQLELRDISGTFNLQYQLTGSVSGALGANSVPTNIFADSVLTTVETGYEYVDFETVSTAGLLADGYGDTAGDTALMIKELNSATQYSPDVRITRNGRTQDGLQPGDTNYLGALNDEGGMRFSHAGKTHQVVGYEPVSTFTTTASITVVQGETLTQAGTSATAIIVRNTTGTQIEIYNINGTFDASGELTGSSSGALGANSVPLTTPVPTSYGFIEFNDVTGSNIHLSPQASGLNSAIGVDFSLSAGPHKDSTAEITVAISLLRATGHDFTQIGTGSFNESNYPNVILGPPVKPLAEFYTDADTASSAQVWERRKGRVFFVSSDQDGFFRVGKFFSVDQATGDITFAGEIGLSNANSLGFKKGVTINEFSADDGFTDQSGQAVPTEKAVGSYINRTLGYTVSSGAGGAQIPSTGNRIGPGFLALNGVTPMEGALNAGSFQIGNVGNPLSGSDAANKLYVDLNTMDFDNVAQMRDFTQNSPASNELLVSTGNRVLYTERESGGVFAAGDQIVGSNTNATGIITQVAQVSDEQFGDVTRIVYVPSTGTFDSDQDVVQKSIGGTPVSPAIQAPCISRSTIGVDNAGGPFVEYSHASPAAGSELTVTVSRTSNATTVDYQIKPGVIVNADVSSSAGILQSKLAMQGAKLLSSADGITQASLGLASFESTEFWSVGSLTFVTPIDPTKDSFITQRDGGGTIIARAKVFKDYTGLNNSQTIAIYQVTGTFVPNDDTDEWAGNIITAVQNTGFIELQTSTSTTTGVAPEKLQYITTDTVLGRSAAGTGAVGAVPFATVISEGGGILESDFGNFTAGGTDVLLRTALDTFTTKRLSTGSAGDTVVLRNVASTGVKAGSIRAEALILGGNDTYEVLSLSGTTLQVKTPGQATVLNASGTQTSSLVVDVPGIANVGKPYLDPTAGAPVLKTTESQVQTNTGLPSTGGRQGKGFVASNWVYTKAIENLNNGSGLAFGNNVGFLESEANSVIVFTNDTARLKVNDTETIAYGNIIPDATANNRDLGSSTAKWKNLYVQTLTSDGSSNAGDILPTQTATYNLGSASLKWNDLYIGTVSAGAVNPSAHNTQNQGSSSNRWNTIYATTFNGTATSANYADLAENYLADDDYEFGTVLIFGGALEVTCAATKGDKRVAGIVSEKPAYLMNSGLEGQHVVAVALQGRVPCKVLGKVSKGDMLVTSAIPGYAIVDNDPRIGSVLGKAVGEKTSDGKGVVEIVVGRL